MAQVVEVQTDVPQLSPILSRHPPCVSVADLDAVGLEYRVIGSIRALISSWVHFLAISMIFTSGPREILAMKPRFECCLHRRDIRSNAERISAAASSPVNDEDVMLKKRTLAAMTACFSSWLYRIRSSRVMTIQPFAPASRSQTTSSVP